MSRTLTSTPADDGFRMPGEFEPHRGCWMLWPERADTWRQGAHPAQLAYTAVAAAIATSEPVTVGASHRQYQQARAMLPDSVRVLELSSDDAWIRDSGPTFVVNGKGDLRGVDWNFNAYGGTNGGLYFPWAKDDQVARKVIEVENCDRYRAPLVLEGGAVHVDGQGTLLTTEECLLNPNRNPQMDHGQLEILLHEYLGVSTVIWLGKGVPFDETGGHIDELCCFVRPGEVLLTWTDNRRDSLYSVVRDAANRLSQARDARGRKLKIHKIPQPGPLYLTEREAVGIETNEHVRPRPAGDRIAASYVNCYIGNSVVVMPLLDVRYDKLAARLLKRLFPRRRVIGVPAREIFLGGGGVHCITQQVPNAVAPQGQASRGRAPRE